MKFTRLKNIYESIKVYLYIDDCIISLLSDYLKKGKIIKVISYDKKKFSQSNASVPVEYLVQENLVTTLKVLTENREIFIIKEEYLGLNFESPCDTYKLTIFDSDGNVIGNNNDLDEYLKNKRKKR